MKFVGKKKKKRNKKRSMDEGEKSLGTRVFQPKPTSPD